MAKPSNAKPSLKQLMRRRGKGECSTLFAKYLTS
jgi:hypothetical protein